MERPSLRERISSFWDNLGGSPGDNRREPFKGNFLSENIDIALLDPEELQAHSRKVLLSGMLLNHSLLYSGLEFGGSGSRLAASEEQDYAFIVHSFCNLRVDKQLIYRHSASQFFESDRPTSDGIHWIHLADPTFLDPIIAKFNLPNKLVKFFNDKLLRANFIRSCEDDIFISLLSFCIQDRYVCAKRLTAYANKNLLITFEQRVHAPEEDIDMRASIINDSNPLLTVPSTPLGPESTSSHQIRPSNGNEFRRTISHNGLNNNGMNTGLTEKNDLLSGYISGILLLSLLERINNPKVIKRVCEEGEKRFSIFSFYPIL